MRAAGLAAHLKPRVPGASLSCTPAALRLGVEEPSENGEEPKPKKKTRRGTRGGRGRKRKPVESSPEAGQESPLA